MFSKFPAEGTAGEAHQRGNVEPLKDGVDRDTLSAGQAAPKFGRFTVDQKEVDLRRGNAQSGNQFTDLRVPLELHAESPFPAVLRQVIVEFLVKTEPGSSDW
jgi:hypothetical protein